MSGHDAIPPASKPSEKAATGKGHEHGPEVAVAVEGTWRETTEAVERQPVAKLDHRVGVALHPRERQEQNARAQARDDGRGGCGVVYGGLVLVTLQCHQLIISLSKWSGGVARKLPASHRPGLRWKIKEQI